MAVPGERVGDDAALLLELTGAPQAWVALCQEVVAARATPAVRALLEDDAGPWARALRRGRSLADPGEELAAEPEIVDVRAADAIRGLALCLAGRPERAAKDAVAAMLDHADDAQLHSTGPCQTRRLVRSLGRAARLTDELAEVLGLLEASHRASASYVALLACHLVRGPVLPTRPDIRLPVLFDVPATRAGAHAEPGAAGWLSLGSLADGPPGLHPDPRRMAFFYSPTPAFATSLSHAWAASPLAGSEAGVCWTLTLDAGAEGPANTVQGGSLGGAFAVGLAEVHRRRTRRLQVATSSGRGGPALDFRPRVANPRAAVSATLTDPTGRLGPVAGLDHKLAAAARCRLDVVIAHPRALHTAPGDAGVAVETALSVRDAIRHTRTATNRRFIRTVGALIVLALCLTLVAVAFGQVAAANRRRARWVAAEQALREAAAVREADPRLALQLGVASVALNPSPASRAELAVTLAGNHLIGAAAASDGVLALAADRTGSLLATGSEDGRLAVWRLEATGTPRPAGATLASAPLRTLAFAADGRTLYAGDTTNCLTVWDAGRPGGPARLPWRDPSPAARCGSAERADLPLGRQQDLALDRTGRVLAAASSDGTLSLFDVADPGRPRRLSRTALPGSGVWAVAFAPRADLLVSGEADGTVTVWDVADPTRPRRLGERRRAHTDIVRGIAFSPAGTRFVTGGLDNAVRVWEVAGSAPPRLSATLRGHAGDVFRVAWAADGRSFLSAGADRRVIVWDAADLGVRARMRGQNGYLRALSVLPGGRAVTGSLDGTLYSWRLAAPGEVERRAPYAREGGKVRAVAFGPDGVTLAVGTSTGSVRVHDTARPEAGPVTVPRASGPVWDVAFAPDGALIDAGSGRPQLRAWEVRGPGQPTPLWSRSTSHGTVYALAVDPSGRWLATGSADGTVAQWRADGASGPAGEGRVSVDPVTTVDFRPQGRSLAAGGLDKAVTVFEAGRPGPLTPLATARDHDEAVYAARYSPDGRLLAASSADGSTSLWSTAEPDTLVRVAKLLREDHTRRLRAEAFSPDGSLLVTGGDEGMVQVWTLTDPASPHLLADIPAVEPPPTGDAEGVLSLAYGRSTLAVGTGSGEVQLYDLSALEELVRSPRELACVRAGSGLDRAAWALHLAGVPYERTCG